MGAVNAVVFGLDPDTRSKLTLTHIRVGLKMLMTRKLTRSCVIVTIASVLATCRVKLCHFAKIPKSKQARGFEPILIVHVFRVHAR